jgi:hypothetical protein
MLLTAAYGRRPSFGVQDVGVLVKGLLRYAVERERGEGALQVRSHHASRAVGAAPAREFVVLCSDHVLSPVHLALWTSTEGWTSGRGEKSCR